LEKGVQGYTMSRTTVGDVWLRRKIAGVLTLLNSNIRQEGLERLEKISDTMNHWKVQHATGWILDCLLCRYHIRNVCHVYVCYRYYSGAL